MNTHCAGNTVRFSCSLQHFFWPSLDLYNYSHGLEICEMCVVHFELICWRGTIGSARCLSFSFSWKCPWRQTSTSSSEKIWAQFPGGQIAWVKVPIGRLSEDLCDPKMRRHFFLISVISFRQVEQRIIGRTQYWSLHPFLKFSHEMWGNNLT